MLNKNFEDLSYDELVLLNSIVSAEFNKQLRLDSSFKDSSYYKQLVSILDKICYLISNYYCSK